MHSICTLKKSPSMSVNPGFVTWLEGHAALVSSAGGGDAVWLPGKLPVADALPARNTSGTTSAHAAATETIRVRARVRRADAMGEPPSELDAPAPRHSPNGPPLSPRWRWTSPR